MKSLFTSLIIMAFIPLAFAQSPTTKTLGDEYKYAFVTCVTAANCWPADRCMGLAGCSEPYDKTINFFEHPRIRLALAGLITPGQYKSLVAKQGIITKVYHVDRNSHEEGGRLQQIIIEAGFCPQHNHEMSIEACDQVLVISFSWTPPWEKGNRIRISTADFYQQIVGDDGKHGTLEFVWFARDPKNRTAVRQALRPVIYWQDSRITKLALVGDLFKYLSSIQENCDKNCLTINEFEQGSRQEIINNCQSLSLPGISACLETLARGIQGSE